MKKKQFSMMVTDMFIEDYSEAYEPSPHPDSTIEVSIKLGTVQYPVLRVLLNPLTLEHSFQSFEDLKAFGMYGNIMSIADDFGMTTRELYDELVKASAYVVSEAIRIEKNRRMDDEMEMERQAAEFDDTI